MYRSGSKLGRVKSDLGLKSRPIFALLHLTPSFPPLKFIEQMATCPSEFLYTRPMTQPLITFDGDP